jgi:hypothetical protein
MSKTPRRKLKMEVEVEMETLAGGERMKKYIGYDAGMGPAEGAALIFANTAKEARKVLWEDNWLDIERFIDVRINLIRGDEFLEKEKEHDYPHVVRPIACDSCNMWGISEIGEDGLCDDCRKEKRGNLGG